MPQPSSKLSWLRGSHSMDQQARSEQEFKLPLRQWLINKLDQNAFRDVEWIDREEGTFKIPWTQKHYPLWKEHFEIFRAWAKHKDKYDESNPPDEKKLKGNFRCALHKSVDFEEQLQSNAMGQQTGNYKIYRVLKREEVREKNRLKKKTAGHSQKQDSKSEQKSSQHLHHDIKMSPSQLSQEATASYQVQDTMQQPYAAGMMQQPNQIGDAQSFSEFAELQPMGYPAGAGDMQAVGHGCFPQRTLDDIAPLQPVGQTPVAGDFEFAVPAPVGDQDLSIGALDNNDLLECSPGNPLQAYDESPMSIGGEQGGHQGNDPTPQAIECMLQTFNIAREALHKFEVEIKYDGQAVAHRQFDCSRGCRIFYGDESMQKAIVEAFGRQVPSPGFDFPAYSMPKCVETGSGNLHQILTRTDQGFTLKCDDAGNLWVTRLCQSVLFYYDPERPAAGPIKLERYKPVKLISSYELARKAIQQYQGNLRKPSHEFALYVGSKPRAPNQLRPVVLNVVAVAAGMIIDNLFGSESKFSLFFSQQNSLDGLLRML